MSGGVDSSVAAALLQAQGHEVVGVFMRLGSPGETIDELQPFDTAGGSCDPQKVKIGHQGCCSINDAADARSVAAHLGIPLYVCNFKKDFGRIIDYFVDEYARGRTPNPCVRCNDWLKFGKLHEYARQIGAEAVASGHYARVVGAEEHGLPLRGQAEAPGAGETGRRLLRGVDDGKDQSYVLFGIARDRLSEMLLPIGGYTKPEIRAIAEQRGLEAQVSEQASINARLRERNAVLEREVLELKTGQKGVEQRAREELGLVREGETFYQVVEKPVGTAKEKAAPDVARPQP